MRPLASGRARALVSRLRGKRVLVLGDVMLDEFLWGTAARLSPEAPVPVVEVARHSWHVGGAANVAANVRALGGHAVLAGVVGQDRAADTLRETLLAQGVEARLAVAQDGRPTTQKTRVIAHHQQVVRADREVATDIPRALEDDLVARVVAALPASDVLVVSDYQKGVVTPGVMKRVLALARRRRVPVLVDPKVRHYRLYRRVALLKPNVRWIEHVLGVRADTDEALRAAGERILRLLGCEALLVTRGERGMSLFRPGRRPAHVPTAAREVYDVTGAGDTAMATLALGLAAGASLEQAAVLANHAAGVVVGKLGTATVSAEELLATLIPTGPA